MSSVSEPDIPEEIRRRFGSHHALLQRHTTQIHELEAEAARQRRRSHDRFVALLPLLARLHGWDSVATSGEAKRVAVHFLEHDPVFLGRLLDAADNPPQLTLAQHRALTAALYGRGYLSSAVDSQAMAWALTGSDRDEHTLRLRRGEIHVMSGAHKGYRPAPATDYQARPDHVLHVVGHALPQTQSGYTLRTHGVVRAQRRAGVQAAVVCQIGEVQPTEGPTHPLTENGMSAETALIDDVTYIFPHGPRRGSMPLDAWLDANIKALHHMALEQRPAALHAHADFINALSAGVVADSLGIPWTYEARGFWEESWLSRILDRFGIASAQDLSRINPLPEMYTWRRDREIESRGRANHVFTLAEVMATRIVEQGLPPDRITVVPNSVDSNDFPLTERDVTLGGQLGIAEDVVTIGYITSMVEYEGVDVLLEAFADLREMTERPTHLLLVGDGPVLDRLKELTTQLGLDEVVTFTGRVPHESVLAYYSLIDIFVVPRRPTPVCEFVTPMKPFEAMSTGRCLVMSDVGALREIAQQSRGARLFTAGSPSSLAALLHELLEDPDQRARLGSHAAQWVRDRRQWEDNNAAYLNIYQQLGVVPTHELDAEEPLSPLEHDAFLDWISVQSATDSSRVGYLADTSAHPQGIHEIMTTGWAWLDEEPIVLSRDTSWDLLAVPDRSWGYHLHAWEPISTVLSAHFAAPDPSLLRWCVDVALSWAERFTEGDAGETQAWYDMALGQRAPVLAHLVREAIRADFPADEIHRLLECCLRHRREIASPGAYNVRTNHGFYTAVGQIRFAELLLPLPGMSALAVSGQERLLEVMRTQFAADGGHLEHSPGYHLMLVRAFQHAIDEGAINDAEVIQRVHRAASVEPWFVQPDNTIVPLGDTAHMVATRPTEGLPTGVLELPDSGYVFARGTDDDGENYLAFQAGFHSRTHKHCDDLSLVWWHKGVPVIVDGGRWSYGPLLPMDSPLRALGFYYAAPERQYVEGSFAHSTLRMTARDHDRRRVPYGSGIRQVDQQDGTVKVRGEADHGAWTHHRTIAFLAGSTLEISDRADWVNSDGEEVTATYLFDGELSLERHSDHVLSLNHAAWDMPLWVVVEGGRFRDPIRGQDEPLRGWRSPTDRRLIPAWSVLVHIPSDPPHEITVRFTAAPEAPTS